MTAKQFPTSLQAPDGSYYVTLVDGVGNLAPAGGVSDVNTIITDPLGVNQANVKPASTAPLSTDSALVTTLSPNSPGIVALGQTTKSGSVPVTMASDQAVTYKHIAVGQATTVVKASAGTLYGIVFNTAASATNVTTIYDNASGSGTVIGIPSATVATIAGLTLEYGPYGVAFANGLTIITATANGADMTVIYQ